MKKNLFMLLPVSFSMIIFTSAAGQGQLSFQCKQLNISKSETLKCDPMSEDDPKDLAEAYGYLITFFPAGYKGTDHRFELHFPTRIGTYHWTKSGEHDKNDSLGATLYYNFDPQNGHKLEAYPKDFTITVTRYDIAKKGIVEGTFEGTMEAFTAWNRSYVTIPVTGDFRTIRTGDGWEDRKQRQVEKNVISRAVNVCDEVFTRSMQNLEWKIDQRTDAINSQIGNNPAPFSPLFLDRPLLDLKLMVNPESKYGKILNDSLEYYGNQASKDPDDYKGIARSVRNVARIQQMQQIEITVNANVPYLKQEHPMDKKDHFTVLHIPDIPYACQVYNAPENDLSPPAEYTSLYFGNWAGADMNAKTYTGFPFVHKHSFPAIENIVVKITGPASAADAIIKKIDWSKLNEALSK